MQIKINFFDDSARLELAGDEPEPGKFNITRAVLVFLGRPDRPHLTFFAEPNGASGLLTPHFTAGRHPKPFRRTLARIRPAAFAAVSDRFATEFLPHYAASLGAFDPAAMEAAGWTIHWADARVLRRWARLARFRSGEFRFDRDVISSMAWHVLGNVALPTALGGLCPSGGARLLALRWDDASDEPEVRALVYFPDGCGTLGSDGEPVMARPPGWYTHPMKWDVDAAMTRVFPTARVEKTFQTVKGYLARYEKSQGSNSTSDGDALPDCVSAIGTYYFMELLDAAINVSLSPRDGLPRTIVDDGSRRDGVHPAEDDNVAPGEVAEQREA